MSQTPSPLTSRRFAILLMGAVICLAPRPAHAGSNLRQELAVVADNVSKFLKAREEDSIAIAEFPGPAQLAASSGPTIVQILTEELEKKGVAVKRRSNLSIEGRYRDAIDAASKRLAAQISGQVVDRAGQVLFEFNRGVFGDTTLSELFGVTAELPAAADDKTRDELLRKQLDEPQVTLKSSRISASPDSPYAIELLVAAGNEHRSCQASNDEGMAFVELQRDQTYAVRLINDSPHDAAVTLTIDGLGMFSFSEHKEYRHVIIAAHSQALIKGWHRTNQVSDAFVITEYAKSAAAELKSSAPTGSITATFAAAWPKGSAPPADEPKNPSDYARSGDATGRGPQVSMQYKVVERNFGVVRSTVSVRYKK